MASFGDDEPGDDNQDLNEADDNDDQDLDDPQGDDEDLDDDDQGDEPGDDDQGDDEPGEGDEAQAAGAINDDATVEVTVNGEAQTFTIGSLKRLAGQEAALTQKSQEAELVGGRAAAALQAALEAAQEDLQPYAGVDWLVLQNQLDPAEFEWHRQNAQRAQTRFEKLVGAAQNFEDTVQQRRQADTARAAQACIADLTDPKTGIPGWNDKVYGEIMAFGVENGLPQDEVAQITNPAVIKLLRKAMLYDRGQKVATQKVKAAPTKVLKGGSRQDSTSKTINVKKASQRLARSGSEDDAVALLMGRWS
jgi:hypothetical protein